MFIFGGKEKPKTEKKFTFKQMNTLEQRKQLRARFSQKYSEEKYVTVVVEGVEVPGEPNKNFTVICVEGNLSVLMAIEYIRQRFLSVQKKESFFVKIRNQIRGSNQNIGELFRQYAEEDGFLYVEIKKESVF